MITAVDTSVLLDVFLADPEYGPGSAAALREALRQGPIIANSAVWAEICSALPEGRAPAALERLGLVHDPTSRSSAELAGEMWRRYRLRGGLRARVVADFLIGAHARLQADRLLTRDRGFYRDHFDELEVMAP